MILNYHVVKHTVRLTGRISNVDTNIADNHLMTALMNSSDESQRKAAQHEILRKSDQYQEELSFLKHTVQDLNHSLRICELAASESREFTECYLLPRYLGDLVEAALTAQLAIESGALNPARRELRYMLELAVNVSYVDEIRAKDSFDERIKFYKGKQVSKNNVDHALQLPFRMLGKNKEPFAYSVRNAWVRASNYVPLTKTRVDQKLCLREKGVRLGMETLTMLQDLVSEVYEVCSIVIVLAFETIGPSFTGDLLVNYLDEQDHWIFHANKYISIIDIYFDYKPERKEKREQISKRRERRIEYSSAVHSSF